MARDSTSNPFRPGAGAVPEVWIGSVRTSSTPTRISRLTRLNGMYTPGKVFIGPSDIGKSVLVSRFTDLSTGDVILDAVRVA